MVMHVIKYYLFIYVYICIFVFFFNLFNFSETLALFKNDCFFLKNLKMQFYWINATTYSTSSIFNVARCKKWKLYEWIIGHWNTFDFIYLQCSLLFTNKLSIFAKKNVICPNIRIFFVTNIIAVNDNADALERSDQYF